MGIISHHGEYRFAIFYVKGEYPRRPRGHYDDIKQNRGGWGKFIEIGEWLVGVFLHFLHSSTSELVIYSIGV